MMMKDSMNFHDKKTLFVLRKDGHYDILYKEKHMFPDIERFAECDLTFNTKLISIKALD